LPHLRETQNKNAGETIMHAGAKSARVAEFLSLATDQLTIVNQIN